MKVKTTMWMARVKKISKRSKSAKDVTLPDIAIFFAVGWIVIALLASPLLRIHWFATGDFSYSGAMYYHGIMVPVLILMYLLTIKILPLNLANGRAYTAGAILSILFVGIGSIFNTSEGISVATVSQIIGMVMTDCLGIVLVVSMAKWALRQHGRAREVGTAFQLLFSSIIAILIAAPLGHFAGWFTDLGAKSIPGLHLLLNSINIKPDEFQDGLVASHSHLIVAALLCGLAAITAICFQYQAQVNWKKKISILGLWIALISLLMVTIVYVSSALAGWEPPVFFASGPNGIPLDDLILTAGEIGILLLLAGLSGSKTGTKQESFSFLQSNIFVAILATWIFSFVGAVVLGIYVEFHETFYGAGISPAPGALNDNVFIRAHLLFPFFMLPAIVTVLLAVACQYGRAKTPGAWPFVFVWMSMVGMALGLTGEILWFIRLNEIIFRCAMVIMTLSLTLGAISLWPWAGILPTTARTDFSRNESVLK